MQFLFLLKPYRKQLAFTLICIVLTHALGLVLPSKHEDLLDRCEKYGEFFEHQFRDVMRKVSFEERAHATGG